MTTTGRADELRQAAETLREHPLSTTLSPDGVRVLADWLQHEAVIAEEDEADGYEVGPRFPGLVLARLINGGAA